MKIACTCEKCGNIFIQEEDDVCLNIDFKQKQISFICRNKLCKHDNILDLTQWQDKVKKNPLPRIGLSR